MDLNYLVNEILPQRKREIEAGKNASTRQPIYVVLSLNEQICSGHNEFGMNTNMKGIDPEFGYIDMDKNAEDRVFSTSDKRMKNPQEVTRYYTDTIVAFFLTRKGAEDYLKYQKHNMHNGYIYVFYSGYGNREMDALLKNS